MTQLASYPLSFDSNSGENAAVMGNTKWTNDWKFWMQLLTIAMLAGVAYSENKQTQHKVDLLEKSNQDKTEILIRMENKFEMLNLQIRQLQERLEAKKVVGIVGSLDPIAGGIREGK